jgi:branched-chain amino acid aminotransferase
VSGGAEWVHLDGRLMRAREARLSVLDRGLLYGDGLFETLRVADGRLFRLEAHLERLAASAARIDLPLPWPRDTLAAAIQETIRANRVRGGAIRLTVTRGEGPPGPESDADSEPHFFVTVRPATPAVAAITLAVAGRHPRTFVPGIKSLCFLPFLQARREARRRGFDDALLTAEGAAVEASTANLFIVRQGALWTPDLESGCLPGITRAAILEIARRVQVPAREAPVPVRLPGEAREAFLTSSVAGVVPVASLEGAPLPGGAPGPVTRRLITLYNACVAEEAA